MAKINDKTLWWEAVSGAVSYRIRMIESDAYDEAMSEDAEGPPLDIYMIPYVEFFASEHAPNANGEIEINLSQAMALANKEGYYDTFITAVDHAENESDFLHVPRSFIDLKPLAAPSGGGFR